MFCKKCGSLLKYSEGKLICGCGYSEKGEIIVKDKKKEKKKIEIVEARNDIHSVVSADCPKCGNNKAYTWALQTRAADEPETIFYQCVKCKHKWRVY